MIHPKPSQVFVYGTLKRGQCREKLWPLPPLSVTTGWIHAELFGRSDYPAIRTGGDRVLGEIWRFTSEEISLVLRELDQIEGFNQPKESDLYHRRSVEVFSPQGQSFGECHCYFYAADPLKDGFHRITPKSVPLGQVPLRSPVGIPISFNDLAMGDGAVFVQWPEVD